MALTRTVPLNALKDNLREIRFARNLFSASPQTVKFLSSAPTIESIPNFGGIPEASPTLLQNVSSLKASRRSYS
jgi:hypothetical protein